MGRGFFSKMLELESQSDKDNLKSNVQQFDCEPHESTLGTVYLCWFYCFFLDLSNRPTFLQTVPLMQTFSTNCSRTLELI